jgi:hypothetical protein
VKVALEIQDLHRELASDLDRIRQRFGSLAPYLTLIVRPRDKADAIAVLQTDGEELELALSAANGLSDLIAKAEKGGTR